MNVAAASLQNSLIEMATAMKAENIQLELASAVMKQIQDQQKIQAEGLLKMIRSAPGLDGSGQIVDVLA